LKNILLCSYRDWATKICNNLTNNFDLKANFNLVKTPEEFQSYLSLKENTDAMFFIGWSEIIPKDIVDKEMCFCLHPSLLPKYRGGSPIQHQMLNLEDNSGVTIFKMDEGVDTGPIYFQETFKIKDLELQEVFYNIIEIGTKGFSNLLKDILDDKKLNLFEQDETKSTTYKRRKPDESEITLEDFDLLTSRELSNKINSLQDPYPNAFIRCKDGSILYLKSSSYKE